MRKHIKQFPVLILLLPLVGFILCADIFHLPRTIWSDTEANFIDSVGMYQMVVTDYPTPCKHSYRCEVEVMPSHTRAYLYIMSDSVSSLPSLADTIMAYTSFHRGDSLGNFDYGRYLRLNGIAGYSYASKDRWQLVRRAENIPLHLRPKQWQRRLYERYKQVGIAGDELATLSALTLGYKEDMDKELKTHFQKAGAAHILAVSGLHTGILYTIIIFIVTLFGFYPPLYKSHFHQLIVSSITMVLLIGYAALTGGTPSVVRSVVMLGLVELGRLWHRQPFSLNTLLWAAFIILLFRPTDLFSVSFQLSFAAVFGILTFEPLLRKTIAPLQPRFGFTRSLRDYILPMLTVSFAAQIYTLPISLYYFSQTSNLFFLSNLVAIPLAFLIVVSALLLLTIGWIGQMGTFIAIPTRFFACFLNKSVGIIEHLPYAVSYAEIGLPTVFIMYAIILLFTYLIRISLR